MDILREELLSCLEKYIDTSYYSLEILEKKNRASQNAILSIKGEKEFFIKVTPADRYIRNYELIERLYERGAPFVKPVCGFFMPRQKAYCIVIEWMHGRMVECRGMCNRFAIYPYACGLVEALHGLHDIANESVEIISFLNEEIELYLKIIERERIHFCYDDEFLFELKNQHSLIENHSAKYVHMDLHCQNIIFDEKKQAVLIDYENIMLTDYYREFVYAASFHNTDEDIFWLSTIYMYFHGDIPQKFWEIVKYYSIVHLLRMIVFESASKDQKKIDWFSRSLYFQYQGLKSNEPVWFLRHKPYLGQLQEELLESSSGKCLY